MLCLGCRRVERGRLCRSCRRSLRPGMERVVGQGLVVRPALIHAGPARHLVHLLKYRGVVAAGVVLAEAMAPLVPAEAVLVPVPRLRWRVAKYGIDPALELAERLSRLTGRPVARALSAPLSGRARAGRQHGTAPRFRLRSRVPPAGVVLVDDVITSGATMEAAAAALPGTVGGVTATASVGSPSTGVSHPAASAPPALSTNGGTRND